MTDTFIHIPKPRVKEGSSFNATAYFRDSSDAAEAPATAKYRVDCLTTGAVLQDWTSLVVAVSNTIAMTATFNAIREQGNRIERKQLTVAADPGGDTQTRDSRVWIVENIDNF